MGFCTFNNDFGCTTCLHPSEVLGSMHVFPATNHSLRTLNTTIKDCKNAAFTGRGTNGVTSLTPLYQLKHFDIIRSSPHDFMHCLCLGHIRKLFCYWTSRQVYAGIDIAKTFLTAGNFKQLDRQWSSVSFPTHFVRKVGTAERHKTWKAAECLNFLLYCAVPSLSVFLPSAAMALLTELSMFTHCLLNNRRDSPLEDRARKSQQSIDAYLCAYQEFCFRERMLYNVHQLAHLPRNLADWGSLYHTATFHFEDAVETCVRHIRGSRHFASQIMETMNRANISSDVALVARAADPRTVCSEKVRKPPLSPDVLRALQHALHLPAADKAFAPLSRIGLRHGKVLRCVKDSTSKDARIELRSKFLFVITDICVRTLLSEALPQHFLIGNPLSCQPLQTKTVAENGYIFEDIRRKGLTAVHLEEYYGHLVPISQSASRPSEVAYLVRIGTQLHGNN